MKKIFLTLSILLVSFSSARNVSIEGMVSNCIIQLKDYKENEKILIALKNINFITISNSKKSITMHTGNHSFTINNVLKKKYNEFYDSFVQCTYK